MLPFPVLSLPSDPGLVSAALSGAPGGGAGQGRPPAQRASDADRDTAVDILCAAVGDGRLTLAELDERIEAALSARTLTELAALIADLYPVRPRAAAPRPGQQRGNGKERGAPSRPRRERVDTAERWALLQSLAAPDPPCPASGAPA